MEKKRIVYFDVLNVLAALSVIFLHCNGIVHTYSNTLAWKQALGIEVICYWAVPVFLMLSGANLMNYREKYSTKTFFQKRFMRTLIPFVAWSIIVAVEKGISPFIIGKRNFIDQFFNCKIEAIYWFFIPLFAIYFSMPVLSLLKDNKKILWYMAGGAVVFNSVLPELFRYLKLSYNYNLSMMTVTGLLVFPIIGYLFATTDFSRKQRLIIYALGVLGAVLRYTATYFLSVRDGAMNKMFFGYTSYYSVFLACAVFTFFKYLPLNEIFSRSTKAQTVLKNISGCSLGIYLIHMMVYRLLDNFIPTYCWQWRLLVPFLIYAIALAVTYLLKKIPVVRYIVP